MALDLHPIALLIALGLAGRSLRKGSLTRSGALAALIVGYATMANQSPIYGACLIVFFLAGSQSTKYKASIKSSLVREHDEGGTGAETDISRDWRQVLCNSLFGASCALASRTCRADVGGDLIPAVCQLGDRPFVWGAVAYWGACAGDTFASELGILSKSSPRLITTFRTVQPGTNGGVSLLGTAFAMLGGLVIGTTASATAAITGSRSSLDLLALLAVGTLAGFVGSTVDSLLGATVQQTKYSKKERKVVPTSTSLGGEKEVVVVSGVNLLSNNGVNIVASTITGLAAVALSTRL